MFNRPTKTVREFDFLMSLLEAVLLSMVLFGHQFLQGRGWKWNWVNRNELR